MVLKVYRFQKSAILLTVHGVNWRQHRRNSRIGKQEQTRMWANTQHDGRPAQRRWRPLFNAAKFGWRPLLDSREVTLPRHESRWN